MRKIKGDRLFVNLGASQVRRRLRGFGHGVRKVESAGRNQAVIVHTATGDHLRELESLFAQVPQSASADELDVPVENIRNLGTTSAAWLSEINVHTKFDLEQLGAALAFRLVRQRQPKVSSNLLWAMAAGLEDRDWRSLTKREKESLLAEVEEE